MKRKPLGEMAEPIWGSRGVKTQTVEGETGFACAWRFPGEPQNQRRPEKEKICMKSICINSMTMFKNDGKNRTVF